MENKCWICGRTEEEFKKEFLKMVLADNEISNEMKEAAKNDLCDIDWLYDDDTTLTIMSVTRRVEGKRTISSYDGSRKKESLGVFTCSMCKALLNSQSNAAIEVIEENHSELFDWFDNVADSIQDEFKSKKY